MLLQSSPDVKENMDGCTTAFMYRLSAAPDALDLKLNFNPLMITLCLFLRALADYAH